MSTRKSYRANVLAELVAAKGAEVSVCRLAQVGGLQFQTRIHELRHDFHFKIKNRTERAPNGQVYSYYWLEGGIPVAPSAPTKQAAPAEIPQPKPQPQATLFGDDAPEPHYEYPD